MLDLQKVSILADFFVIATGENERHIRALGKEIKESLGENDIDPLWIEGTGETGWVIFDYGTTVVHLFSSALRSYYQLEKVWSDARPVVVIQ
jgi:ribosome-associated protein